MNNKKLFNAIVKISLISMVLMMSFQVLPISAASLTGVSDTMSRLKAATLSNHNIEFATPTGVDAPTDTITLTFSGQFVMGAVAFGDMDLNVDAACDGVYEISKTLAAAPGVSPLWGAVVAGQVVTLTAPTNAAAGEIAATACVQVLIGTNATGGVNQITNGAADDSDTVAIAGLFGDTGFLVVDIIADDQVVVTADIGATFSFVLSSNTCAIGTVIAGNTNVDTCSYTVTTTTNAVSGYVTTIVPISDGTNYALNNTATATELFNPEGGSNTVTGSQTTSSEYGVGSSDASMGGAGQVPVEASCAEDASVAAAAIYTGSGAAAAQLEVARATGPAAETSTVCHAAAAGTSQPIPGAYSHTVTLISTGTF